MAIERRTALTLASGLAAAAVLRHPLARAQSKNPVKVGLLEDISGDLAVYGRPKLNGSILAMEEINKAGGIMGRPIELIHLDPQGDNARYQEFARRLVQRDKVEVLIGGITSASREAIRPILKRAGIFYYYTNQYEGGVCDRNMVSTGAVPEQQFSTLIPFMAEKFGKRVYTIAADYNFGQLSAEWTRTLMKEQGGQVIGEEFIPLGVSQFAQTIQNIQRAKPDWLMCLNVGAAQDSFFEQAAAARLDVPMGSSIKIMLGFEHKRFAPPALNGMHAVANWFEEIDTPEANAFKARWRARWPEETYINDMGYNAYVTLFLLKVMAEKANSFKAADLHKVAAGGGIAVDAPEGRITLDPQSQHMSHRMRMISVDKDHKVTILKDFGDIKPYWLGQVGCDLTKKDDNEQYSPSSLPRR
ncbi:urea ABC transporter substrate-binding protein [Paracraurococcus lichenis]|uniref:Urea ABC transporter substrate-binding protein n=1 Tax=Paracraurococcus lichenis TaxID=3064888 RepID=A0ABT9E191_9PROT|nr:urea ABC transporter substrate-binding protein [Paracraurococcus sp. LOR1-02]MDO9709908.1 urea ABC transporter substrate-binding protein [Paracraurococcus sp. LOR1-02]